jgi:hypothetical protein
MQSSAQHSAHWTLGRFACGTLRVEHFLVVEPVETLASSFFYSHAVSQPAHKPLTQTVSPLIA